MKNKGKVVYFVRHGESEDSENKRFQSPTTSLSKKGRENVLAASSRFKSIDFEIIISSSFERAKQTAEIINKVVNKNIEFSSLFTECLKPSKVDGKEYTDKYADELWRIWQNSFYENDKRVEDGETFDDIRDRVDQSLKFLEQNSSDKIMVVSHGFFIKAILSRIILGDMFNQKTLLSFQNNLKTTNSGVTVLQQVFNEEGKASWQLKVFNEVNY
jgi:broad specificity phosphatase PhoE